MSTLAIYGGEPVIKAGLPTYRSMGATELKAVARVIESGTLSGFYGSWCDQFLGGPEVREFERRFAEQFRSKHCVSVNSATSGLFAAVGASGVGPGDEIIVPPYTMSATAMAPLIYGALPVFVDIEPETFCLDPEKVRLAITPRTKVIIAVNLFGHPARLHALRALADEKGLLLIEDNAQGPLAEEDGRYAGTIGHIGVFSLNYHKHIHTGEGGMCLTGDETLARRLQLIRNHGENCVEDLGFEDITNLVGFNYRLTELSAAVGLAQLDRAEEHVGRRIAAAEMLTRAMAGIDAVTTPAVRSGCRHVYYTWSAKLDEAKLGAPRATFLKALAAEGVPLYGGYVRPLYLLPVFQRRRAFGPQGWPFTTGVEQQYARGLCPVCERMHDRELFFFENCLWDIDEQAAALIGDAFAKVYENRKELTRIEV